MKIRVVCTQVMSSIVGHGCQPWGMDAGENQPPKGTRHQVSFEMADQESGHGGISVRVADEIELAKWVPGVEYDLLIEGTSLVAVDELNDDGIVGMYTDPPQPIESAGGGVQQFDTANQITVTVDDNLNVVKTGTSGPTMAERLAFSGINPSDLNVDADE